MIFLGASHPTLSSSTNELVHGTEIGKQHCFLAFRYLIRRLEYNIATC